MTDGLRVVEWSPRILERLEADDAAHVWGRALVDAGFIVALDDHPRWEPARRLRRAVAAMEEAEVALAAARRPVAWSTGGIDPRVSLLFVVPLVLLSLVVPTLVAVAIVAVTGGLVAGVGLAVVARQRRRLRRDERAAVAAREAAGREARAALEALFVAPFCAATGPVLVRCWGWRPGEKPTPPPTA